MEISVSSVVNHDDCVFAEVRHRITSDISVKYDKKNIYITYPGNVTYHIYCTREGSMDDDEDDEWIYLIDLNILKNDR